MVTFPGDADVADLRDAVKEQRRSGVSEQLKEEDDIV
jgi:hypothetical protein